MSFGDSIKKLIGIDDIDDDEDFEITQDEINREKARMDAASGHASVSGSGSSKPSSMMTEPIAPSFRVDSSYADVAPLLSKTSEKKVSQHSMNASGAFKMIVIEPKNFDECSKLVDNLKARKPVIINLENVETDLARKIFDFLSGATCALSGNVQRVTQNIFIFAPSNVNIAAKLGRNSEVHVSSADNNKSNSSPWR